MSNYSPLVDYVLEHSERGACTCGQCVDAPENPEQHQPEGHTADLVFFEVCATGEPDAETFRSLLAEHRGVHCDCSPLDGRGHNYIELGAWVGDQGIAMQMMGLGHLLGVWKLLTPKSLGMPAEFVQHMAGMGLIEVGALDKAATE